MTKAKGGPQGSPFVLERPVRTPQRLERPFGGLGARVADGGKALQRQPRLAHTRPFKAGKRLLQRVVAGDCPFTPEQVATVMEATIRRIIVHEDVLLIVKATGYGRDSDGVLGPYWERFGARRDRVDALLRPICAALSVTYYAMAASPPKSEAGLDDGDGIHKDSTGQYFMGFGEGEVMARAWAAQNQR